MDNIIIQDQLYQIYLNERQDLVFMILDTEEELLIPPGWSDVVLDGDDECKRLVLEFLSLIHQDGYIRALRAFYGREPDLLVHGGKP